MKKTISLPIAITVLVVCAVLTGLILTWQYLKIPKGEEKITEIKSSEGEEGEEEEDETADWEVYQNKEIGIEFNYPFSWRVNSTWEKEDYIEINFGFKSEPLPEEPGYTPGPSVISILIENNPERLSAEEFYDGDPGNNYFKPPDYYADLTEPYEVLVIGEGQVYRVCFGATYCGDCIYIVPFKKHFVVLDLCCFCDELHNDQKLIIQSLKTANDF